MTPRAQELLDRLPHRPPFRFLSHGIELTDGDSARAVWHVRGDEPWLEGHFPGHPIVPGVLIGEALAQLSGLIVVDRSQAKDGGWATDVSPGAVPPVKLGHVELRFKETVIPPAEIQLASRLERVFGGLWQFEVLATVGERRAARGSLTLAVNGRVAWPSGARPC
ncbi:MAG: 3-hydroxyacyl-ACP dehydratase FabZ family protein [Phycisphaerae bacterium]